MSRQTFYNWKSRFEAGGDAALEKLKSHAPKQPRRTPDSICEQIILMRQHHPDWGKRRIAAELKKSNGWVALVSPNTVRRILIEAGMWEPPATKKLESAVRTAEMPGQTINVDLCFVPLTHHPEAKLPAISGSSGKLVFQSGTAVDKAPHYPGRVFEDDKLPYTSAMEGFVSASRDKDKKSTVSLPIDGKRSSVKERQRIVHEEEVALRNERRSLRQQRKKEDAAWKRAREQRRQQTMAGNKTPSNPKSSV